MEESWTMEKGQFMEESGSIKASLPAISSSQPGKSPAPVLPSSVVSTVKSEDTSMCDIDDLLKDDSDDEIFDSPPRCLTPPPPRVASPPLPTPSAPAPPSRAPSDSKPRPDRKTPPLICQMCNKSFGKKESKYNSHVQELHNFPCKYCDLKFTFKSGRRDHKDSKHQEETTTSKSTTASRSGSIGRKATPRPFSILSSPRRARRHTLLPMKANMLDLPVDSARTTTVDSPTKFVTFTEAHRAAPSGTQGNP